jgi:hypothetical protein
VKVERRRSPTVYMYEELESLEEKRRGPTV